MAGGFDRDVGVVDGLAEEVVGADRAGYVVSGAVVALGLVVFSGELDGDFELGQDVAFDIEGDFGGVGGRGCIAHKGAEMVSAEVDLVGEGELGGGDAELVGFGGFLEYLVAAGVFHLEGEFAAGDGLVIGAVERQGANVDGLARLVDRLLRGEKNGGCIVKLDRLGVLG